jgi:hypothetical protein
MSEPLVDATNPSSTPSFLLDGDLPRLGEPAAVASPAAAPSSAPPASAHSSLAPPSDTPVAAPLPRPTGPSPVMSAPGATPVLGVPDPMPSLPTLPTVAPATQTAQPSVAVPQTPVLDEVPDDATPVAQPEHPMAHLMPEKTGPSEASKRAADIRAAKKAKVRKIKIGVAIGAIVIAAVVGPPLGKWFVNAINEAGSTSTEVDD